MTVKPTVDWATIRAALVVMALSGAFWWEFVKLAVAAMR